MTARPEDRLQQGVQELGLALDAKQQDALLQFLDLIVKWNRVYNLTSVRDEDMLTHHVLDSLAVVAPLQRYAQQRGGLPALRLLDVGSGAGLPGVVLAVAQAKWQVLCVDAVGKKASFMTQAAGKLGLGNLRAMHSRVEDVRDESFDVIVSRAFSGLEKFTALTRQLLAPDGAWVAMKGAVDDREQSGLPADIEVFHVEHLHVPGLDAQRSLIWMRPAGGR